MCIIVLIVFVALENKNRLTTVRGGRSRQGYALLAAMRSICLGPRLVGAFIL